MAGSVQRLSAPAVGPRLCRDALLNGPPPCHSAVPALQVRHTALVKERTETKAELETARRERKEKQGALLTVTDAEMKADIRAIIDTIQADIAAYNADIAAVNTRIDRIEAKLYVAQRV